MDELEIIDIIKSNSKSEYIGDDCAYLKELGIVFSQDNLTEDVHFKRDWYTPYDLGYKSAAVNISDILASGAKPAYLSLGISLPNGTTPVEIADFIKGIKDASCDAELIGGDTTATIQNKLFISITAIGVTKGRKISSRKNAKAGYVVAVSGEHGSSAAGLKQLQLGDNKSDLIQAHIRPQLDIEFSKTISENIKDDYAMMDTSDGLCDALFKIAESSGVKIIADYSKIPHNPQVNKHDVLFGGEDYKLVAAIPENFAKEHSLTIIGRVLEYDGTRLEIDNDRYCSYNELDTYKHFGGDND